MLNLDKSIRILEFDKIRDMLAALASTKGAKNRARSLTPSSNSIVVKRRQELTKNAKEMAGIKGLHHLIIFLKFLILLKRQKRILFCHQEKYLILVFH